MSGVSVSQTRLHSSSSKVRSRVNGYVDVQRNREPDKQLSITEYSCPRLHVGREENTGEASEVVPRSLRCTRDKRAYSFGHDLINFALN